MKYFVSRLTTFVLLTLASCSNFGAGFAGYEKPPKKSNKYYRPDFKMTNPKLKLCRKYIDLENKGLSANLSIQHTYFVFSENGFVLHDQGCKLDPNNKPISYLKYSEINSEDVGSYLIKGDTIYWGTRPGYLKKKKITYYEAIVSDSGLNVINSSQFVKSKFFRLQ